MARQRERVPAEGVRSPRLTELDALRGLAAFTVVVQHILIAVPAIDRLDVQPQPSPLWPLVFSPLHIFYAGGEAVMFFFVLSGFVLSIPFYRAWVDYGGFVVRRVFRIYVPYLVAICIAVLLFEMLGRHRINGLSDWFNQIWASPLTPGWTMQHFALIDSFKNVGLNPVIWSLVYEMRISLLFPFLMFALTRFPWATLLVLAGLGFLVPLQPESWGDYPVTVHYMLMFAVGAMLARHRKWLAQWVRRRSRPARTGLVLIAVFAYTYKWWFFPFTAGLHSFLLNDLAATAGSGIFIAVAIGWPVITATLRHGVAALLGRISYSLYLLHALVLLTLVHLLYPVLSLWILGPMTVAVSLAVALASYHAIEAPSNRLGHQLAKRLREPTSPLKATQEAA